MKKTCPKCNVEFECRKYDIENCVCNKVQLNSTALDIIQKEFEDCLCKSCLKELEH